MRTFYLLTVTQVLSIIGSIMTHTALGIRVFSDTGKSTPLLMASFFAALPLMVGGFLFPPLGVRLGTHGETHSNGRESWGAHFLLGKTLSAPVCPGPVCLEDEAWAHGDLEQ